jgi:hypothetical protein
LVSKKVKRLKRYAVPQGQEEHPLGQLPPHVERAADTAVEAAALGWAPR